MLKYFFRMIVMVAVLFSILMLTACKKGIDNTGEEQAYGEQAYEQVSGGEQIDDRERSTEMESQEKNVAREEIQQEGERFTALIHSLHERKITKVELEQVNPGTGKASTYTSDNEATIQKWINVLGKMKTSPTTFDPLLGTGYSITFYEGGTKVEIGGFVSHYIYNTTDRTMNVIDNYADLEEEFAEAKKSISPVIF
jgi:hypothetical protein